MEKKTVYIETTIVSYLTARPSRDLQAAASQQATAVWWETARARFDLVTSQTVRDEAAKGHPEAASRRMGALDGILLLDFNDEVGFLSEALLKAGALPPGSVDDSIHIAIAAVHGVDYLLTWNFRHIDNAETKPMIRSICAIHGYNCPEICTPQELIGASGDGG